MTGAPTALIHFDRARQELELARNIDEVKQIRDQAEVLRQYIRQQGASLEMQNQAAEIKLRAERRAGEMLAERDKNRGTRGNIQEQVSGGHIVLPPDDTPTLADLGLTKMQAQRWQLEAEIPEDTFEEFIAETKAATEELTSRAALAIALKFRRQVEAKDVAPLPPGKYQVIYADPPWQYDFSKVGAWAVEMHYNTLDLEAIKLYKDNNGVAIQEKFANDAVLFMWAPQPKLKDALEVIETWGFAYTTGAVWIKDRLGMGYWWMQKHELLLLAKRGNSPTPDTDKRPPSVFEAPWAGHSKKPDYVYEMIEGMCPLPDSLKGEKRDYYLELFKRGPKRPFWAGFGQQYG